jgi:hypothetical protein
METLASPDWMGGKVPAGVGLALGPQAAKRMAISMIKVNLVFILALLV